MTQINKLAAEVFHDELLKNHGEPHSDVEILPEDNGERFFSEYLIELLKREAGVVKYQEGTNRCMCNACGGRINKYLRPQLVEAPVCTPPTLSKNATPVATTIYRPPATVVELRPAAPRTEVSAAAPTTLQPPMAPLPPPTYPTPYGQIHHVRFIPQPYCHVVPLAPLFPTRQVAPYTQLKQQKYSK